MTVHYCHNCNYHRNLPDGTYCQWCLTFFYSIGKLPVAGDTLPDSSSVAKSYASRHAELLRKSEESR